MYSKDSQSERNNQSDDATRISPERAAQARQSQQDHSSFTDRLHIEGLIGEGGVGRVYLAYDQVMGRRVAVKEMLNPPSDENTELTNSFIHEAKITAKLEHPGIIPIYEIGNRNHYGPYYVMKYIKGITMEERFRFFSENATDNNFKARIELIDPLIDVCKALAYAHEKGVIHRDIKPNNIISGKFGETIIIDWGLAQVISSDGNTQFFNKVINQQQHTLSDSSSSITVGTPRYMSPEQAEGRATKASDVYSLGVILFRIITGKFPYQGSADEIEQQLTSNKPSPSPFQFNPSAPAELVAICEKAIAKSEQQRFIDASELLSQLNDYRNGRMVNVYNYSKKELLHRFFSRHKLLISLLCVLLIAIVTGAGITLHYAYLMNIEKDKAEHALVTITTFSEKAQNEARAIAKVIKSSSDELYADLKLAAREFSQLNQPNSAQENTLLSDLKNQYPRIELFSIRHTDSLTPEISLGWSIKQKYDAPIAVMKDERLQIIFRTPIHKGTHVERYLEAIMYPEIVIPALFPIAPLSRSKSQDVWVMRDDGLIIYDKNLKYIGSNLFTGQINIGSASLLAFGQLTISHDNGIGHYAYIEGKHKIEKIASWNTVQFNRTERWIIIVNYPYLISNISDKP